MLFRELLTKYRERKNLTKFALAELVECSPVTISNFEAKKTKNRYTHPNFETFIKLCEALELDENEKLKLAMSCLNARISEDNKQYIEFINMHKKDIDLSFLDRDDIKQLIKDRFYPLFDDEKVVELLYDTDVLHVLSAIHNIKDKDTQKKKIKSILSLLE